MRYRLGPELGKSAVMMTNFDVAESRYVVTCERSRLEIAPRSTNTFAKGIPYK
jgi:hypothetical protein